MKTLNITSNIQDLIFNIQHSIFNIQQPKLKTRNPKPETRNPTSKTQHPASNKIIKISENQRPNQSQNSKLETRNSKTNIQHSTFNIQNLKPETQNPKPETRNPKLATLFLTIIIFQLSIINSVAQTFENAYRYGSENSTEEIADMKQDAEGNFFITGTFTGTVDFGGTVLTSAGGKDVFVIKTDADNNIIWAISGGGTGNEESFFLTFDSGNCYVGGTFEGLAQFGNFTQSSFANGGIFIIKINSTGNINWFKHGGSTIDNFPDKMKYIHFDNENNKVIIIISSCNPTFGSFHISTVYDVIVKFNNITGEVLSMEEMHDYWSRSITNIPNEKLIISARVFTGKTLAFACGKYSSEGVLEKIMYSDTTYNTENRLDLTQKNISEHYPFIYLVGTFMNSLSWGNFSVINSGQENTDDIFLTKLNLEEDSVYWMKRIGGNQDERVYSIDTDQDKNLYITGYYENTCDFGSGVQLVSQDRSGFVAKYDSLGNVQWAKSVGSGTGDVVNSISVEQNTGDAYIAGCFLGTANFDDITLTSEGSSDLFFAKLGCSPAKPSKITGDTLLCVGEYNYSILNTPSVSYNWQISGGGTITGSSTSNATSINWTTAGTYDLTISSENECGLGVPRTIQIRVKDLPEDLTLTGDTLACLGTEAYNVVLENETAYNWTINGGGMIFGIENTAVVNWTTPGTYNMSITPTNMCGSGNMLSQDIYVSTTPSQPAEISGNTEVCNGSENYAVPANSTIDHNWTLSSGGELSFTENNASINWDASGIHTLTVTATNRCGVGIPRALNVNVSDVPSQVGAINGNRSVCIGTQEYGVLQEAGVSYDWTLSGGGMLTENGNSAEIYWTTAGTYTLGVRPTNNCGNGNIKNIQITVNDAPSQASVIIGVDDVCKGIQTCQTPEIEGVSYTWSLSGGGVLTPNNNTAQVDWDTEGTHTLSVIPYNLCGTGASKSLNVEVSASDAQISGINGNDIVCLGIENYSADYVGGLAYNWQLATGGTINSNSTNNISINWQQTGYHTLILETSDACSQSLVVKVDDVPTQTSEISGDNPVCLGESGYFVNHEQNTTYNWTISEGATLIPSVNTVSADWTDTGIHTLSVTPSNHCGNGILRTLNVDVKTIPMQASEILAEDTACLETTTYTINAVADVSYNWDLENPGGVLIPSNHTADVVWLFPHANTISVSLSNLCGTSALQNKQIVVDDKPELPEIDGITEVCLGEEVYTTTLENGHNYLWSINGGGVLIIENDTAKINWTTTGNHILSLTNSNTCGASETKSIIIKVNDIPNQPEIIAGNNEVCYGIETYEITAIDGINYSWNLDGGGTISELNNSATINWTQTGTYNLSITPSNMCGTGLASTKIINVHTVPAQTEEISGNDAVCLGNEVYSVNNIANTTYNWTLSNGGNLSSADNIATINWTDKGLYTLNVVPSNFCGSGISRTKIINVNDIPEQAIFNNPDITVCIGETNYSVNEILGATYDWQISGGGTLITNSTQNASVNWSATGNYQLSIISQNECGNANTTSINIEVNDVPSQANAISGEDIVCLDNEIYSTSSMPNVSYIWALNGGGNITPNDNSVFVSWLNQGTYELSVTPYNFCGNGTSRSLEIVVNDIPSQTSLILGNDNSCINTDELYSVTNVAGLTYNWSLNSGGTVTETGNSANVSWLQAGNHTISVQPENMCGIGLKRSQIITIKDIPEQAVFNNPEISVCLGETNYSVNEILGATYDWQVSGGGTLITNSTQNASVNWSATGNYQLSITSQNECGNANTTSINIEVNDVPSQVNTISGEDIVCLDNEIYSTSSIPNVSYIWALNGGGNITPNNNSVFVTWLNQGTYELSVTPYNFCGNGTSRSLEIVVNDIPSQTSLISGNDNPCINTDELYSVTNVAGLTYNWSLNSGGTVTETGNSANVSWLQAGNHTISVQPENMCGIGASRSFIVNVMALPNQLSFLSGNETTCIGTDNYVVNKVFGINYDWTLSGGGNLTENENSAIINWTEKGEHTINVIAQNACGNGMPTSLNVDVEQIPEQTAEISGNILACLGEEIYTTNFVNETEYIWNLSGGGNLFNTDNSATINWQSKGNYTLSVQAKNRCGSSLARNLNIETNKIPDNLLTINGETELCKGATENYFTEAILDITYLWKLNNDLLSIDNDTITMTWNEAGNNLLSVRPVNFCGEGYVSNIQIRVSDTFPKISENITGDTVCCYNSNLYYSIDDNDEDLNYFWNVHPNSEFNQSLNSIQTDWQNSGEYLLSVYGKNNCGVSDTSFLKITVENEPLTPQIEFRNDTLFSDIEFGNQWFKDGIIINDAVQNFYTPSEMGNFSVQIKNSCSESLFSENIYFVSENSLPYGINVYPVPVKNNKLTVEFPINLKWDKIEIISPIGQLMQVFIFNGNQKPILKLKNSLRKDVYFIKIYTEKGVILEKILVL